MQETQTTDNEINEIINVETTNTENNNVYNGNQLIVQSNQALDIKEVENILFIKEQNEEIKKKRAISITKEVKTHYGNKIAQIIIDKLLREQKLFSYFKVTSTDGTIEQSTIHSLFVEYAEISIKDPIEPDNETGTIIRNNYFDAEYITNARAGEVYPIIFSYSGIKNVLQDIGSHLKTVNNTFMLEALAKNIVLSGMPDSNINKTIDLLVEYKYLDSYNNFKDLIKKVKWKYKKNNDSLEDPELEALYLLKNYAVIDNNGKLKLVDTQAFTYKEYTKQNLMIKFENNKIIRRDEISGKFKEVNPVQIYLESKHRKYYQGKVFDPSCSTDNSQYNSFKGFKYSFSKLINIDFFKNFVQEIICNSDNLMFNIVWSFMAQIIQEPHIKMGTSLVMTSLEGAGKGVFMKVFGKLLNGYFMSSKDHKRLLGEFNQHLENVLLYYANETTFKDNDKVIAGLKNVTTEVDFTTEVKNGDTYSTKNYTRVVIDSNDEVPVDISEESRRFIQLFVSNSKIGDLEYWTKLDDLINTEGFYESLMFEVYNFDFSSYKNYLRKPPKVKLTQEQIKEGFSAIEAWWENCLNEAYIPDIYYDLTPDEKLNVPKEYRFMSFKKWCVRNAYPHRFNASTFGKEFKKVALCNDTSLCTEGKITINGKRLNSYIYETLSKCREVFIEKKKLNTKNYTYNDWQLPEK